MLSQLKAQAAAHIKDLAQRGSDLVEAKINLLEAKARLALSALQWSGVGIGIYALAGIVALVGFFTAVAAGCVSLAEEFGVPIALAITGGGLILVAVVTVLFGKAILRAGERQAAHEYQAAALAAKAQSAEALHPTGPRVAPDHLLPPGGVPACPPAPAKQDSTLIALSAAAFAVSALVGPRKTARLIKNGVSVTAKAAAAVKLARKAMNQNGAAPRRASSSTVD